MIYILELEKLKERYTDWWGSYIPSRFQSLGIHYKVITGEPLSSTVKTGTVLDASGTNYFKASQLKIICEMFHNNKINSGDSFLVCDIWFPGIEMISYMSELYNIPVNIWGVWHAGSITTNDFAEPMHPWAKYFELGFLKICRGIFVGSEYSKQSITRLFYFIPNYESESITNKIYSYGMPLDFNNLQQYSKEPQNKENIIVFPHRPDPEKNPDIFINIINVIFSFYRPDFSC